MCKAWRLQKEKYKILFLIKHLFLVYKICSDLTHYGIKFFKSIIIVFERDQICQSMISYY